MPTKQEIEATNKLKSKGYFVIKNFLKKKDLDNNFLNYLKKR